MKLKLFSDASLEEFGEGLSLELKRKVFITFAEIQAGSHKATWLPNYQKPRAGHDIYAFEVDDHWNLHSVVWLCLKMKKSFSKNRYIMNVPYVITIPRETTSPDEFVDILEEFFGFLWEDNVQNNSLNNRNKTVPQEFTDVKNKLLYFKKNNNRKFKAKFEKSVFSKTMRFKPLEGIPWITKRNVYAILNTNFVNDDSFQWSLLKRQMKTSATMPVNRSCCQLDYCFNLMMQEETLDENNMWYCSECGEPVPAKSQVSLWQLPKVLIIYFKRFFMDGLRLMKNDTFVKFPTILDVKDYFVGPGYSGRYRLFAVTEHQGSLTGGHYEAKCFVDGCNKWYSFSDASVKEIPDEHIVSPHAYMLFYQHIEPAHL